MYIIYRERSEIYIGNIKIKHETGQNLNHVKAHCLSWFKFIHIMLMVCLLYYCIDKPLRLSH